MKTEKDAITFSRPACQPLSQRFEEAEENWIPTEKLPPSDTFGYVFNSVCRDLETGIPVVFLVRFLTMPINYGGILETVSFARVESSEDWKPLSHYSFWQPCLSIEIPPHPFKLH